MTKLVLDQLGVNFDRWLFRNLALEFQAGDWVTVVGKSGTGKTVLLKTIAGLITPDEGTVWLNEQVRVDYPINEFRQSVSYAVQTAHLFGKTVRDNLDLPFIVRDKKIDEGRQIKALEMMDLPADYLDKEIEELSGGQRQRVGVLRNLLFPPEVLLLDEISTGLDSETKDIMWQAIRQMHDEHQNIILTVTHDDSEIKAATKLLTLVNGEGVLSDGR